MAMRKLSFVLASSLLAASACDSEAVDSDAERSTERSDAEFSNRVSTAVGMFCLRLDCSEQQRAELTAIAQSAVPDEEQRAKHQRAMKTFATAFRADDLDTDVLVALHDRKVVDREHMRDSFLAAHQVLEPSQRDALADMVEDGFGPARMMKTRAPDPAAMAEHMAAQLCDVAACDEDQEVAIAASIADGMPKRSKDEITAMKARFADVLRTDDLDAKTLDRLAAEIEVERDAVRPQVLDTLSEVHSMLSPKQRDAVATKLEVDGPRGLMGPGSMHR